MPYFRRSRYPYAAARGVGRNYSHVSLRARGMRNYQRNPFKSPIAAKYVHSYGTRAFRMMGIRNKGVAVQKN